MSTAPPPANVRPAPCASLRSGFAVPNEQAPAMSSKLMICDWPGGSGDGVAVGVFVEVFVELLVGVGVNVLVGVFVAVLVGVRVGVFVGLFAGMFVGVEVLVGVPLTLMFTVTVAPKPTPLWNMRYSSTREPEGGAVTAGKLKLQPFGGAIALHPPLDGRVNVVFVVSSRIV